MMLPSTSPKGGELLMRHDTITRTGSGLQRLRELIVVWDGLEAPRALLVALAGVEQAVGQIQAAVTVHEHGTDAGRSTWTVFGRTGHHLVEATYDGPYVPVREDGPPAHDDETACVTLRRLDRLTAIRLGARLIGATQQDQSGTFSCSPAWSLNFGDDVVVLPSSPVADGSSTATDLVASLSLPQ